MRDRDSLVLAGLLCVFLVMLVIGSGCATMKGIKQSLRAPATIITTIPTTAVPVVAISQPEVYPVVTESESDYMYRTIGRYLGESFGWRRDDVLGKKDMVVNISVYNYRISGSYQWWSVNNGRYFYQAAPDGMKYLFVFLRMTLEGEDQSKDTGIYGFNASHYAVQYKDGLYYEDQEHGHGVRIAEMQNYQTAQGTEPYDFGWVRVYQNFHEYYYPMEFVRMGKSNAWDGYILFAIPKQATVEDLKIVASYAGFGKAWWKLTNRPI